MTEVLWAKKYTHKLQITTCVQGEELIKVASQVAEILPRSKWIEGTANILSANLDYSAIDMAVKLAGGIKYENECLLDIFKHETVKIIVDKNVVFDSNTDAGVNHRWMDESSFLCSYSRGQESTQLSGVPNPSHCVDEKQQ